MSIEVQTARSVRSRAAPPVPDLSPIGRPLRARSGYSKPASFRTPRWSERELQEEKDRLVAWLDVRAARGLGVPSSRARPDKPSTSLIAKGANVRRSAISLDKGHLKGTLQKYVGKLGLQPDERSAGIHYDRSDRIHGQLVQYIESRKASGLGLPSANGRPNMAAIARGAGIGDSTLTERSHRNHHLVMKVFASMGGATEDPKRTGSLVLEELIKALLED